MSHIYQWEIHAVVHTWESGCQASSCSIATQLQTAQRAMPVWDVLLIYRGAMCSHLVSFPLQPLLRIWQGQLVFGSSVDTCSCRPSEWLELEQVWVSLSFSEGGLLIPYPCGCTFVCTWVESAHTLSLRKKMTSSTVYRRIRQISVAL